MNLRTVASTTSRLLFLVAALMVLPAGLAVFDGASRAIVAYAASAIATAMVGFALAAIGRNAPATLHRKDAIGTVALTWIALGSLGALPFLLEGSIRHPASAVFESVSGFTTTGATVVSDVDGLSRPTNLWRCLSHWIGGMGIVVLFVAVFPQLGVGAKHLFKAEVPGPITEGLRPKIKQTALALWWIYASLTVLATVLLVLADMPLFDAVCHAFSALGTGGFSTKSASVGHYDSALIDWILVVFMLIAGLNFGLFYGLARGRLRDFFYNYELRFFLAVNVVVTLVIWVTTRSQHDSVLQGLRMAAFQTVAVTTTTGFMTEDFDKYPEVARLLLFLCMFMGGCAGSTAGGLKASRIYALLRLAAMEVRFALSPQEVIAVRLGPTAVQPAILRGIMVFGATYMILFAGASLVMVALGLDLLSAMSAVVACLSSVGPGLAQVGPTQNFEFIHPVGKILLSLCMIAGRLEIFALLAVFTPECWRR